MRPPVQAASLPYIALSTGAVHWKKRSVEMQPGGRIRDRIAFAALLAAFCGLLWPAFGADSRPVIACFGDSLTAGFGLDAGQSYPDLLQGELDSRGYHYRVVNLGVSGITTDGALARLSRALSEKPAIVVLELGANDGLRGHSVGNAQRNLSQMIEAFQKEGAEVVLAGITLPPIYGPEYSLQFNAMYPELAARYKLKLIPFLLDGVGGHGDLMQQDGLHPTAKGTRIVETTVWRAIEPLLRK
jgi:acyl-CoA thioesterase I